MGDSIDDNELVNRLRLILKESDLSTITINMIINQLEEYFKCELSEKKPLLKVITVTSIIIIIINITNDVIRTH